MMKKIVPIILVLGLVISLITIPAVSAGNRWMYIDVSPQGPIHTTQNTTELNIRASLVVGGWNSLCWRYLNFDLYNSEGKLILHKRQRTGFFLEWTEFKIGGETLSELPPGDYRAKISYGGSKGRWSGQHMSPCSNTVIIHHTTI
jgi:hypothetical protein